VIPIGLADYLRAVDTLAADAALSGRIAEILGVAESVAATDVANPPEPDYVPTSLADKKARPALDVDFGTPQMPAVSSGHSEHVSTGGTETAELVLRRIEQRPPPSSEQILPLLEPMAGTPAPLPYEPLFHPARSRAHTSAVLSTERNEGEIDEGLLVDLITSASPVRALPRRTRPTLAAGAQIVLDFTDDMLPFRRDQRELAGAIERLAPDDLLEVLSFHRYPLRLFRARGSARQEAYRPPPTGTPVVALTDLGMHRLASGDSAPAASWLDFARKLARSDTPLIALVPNEPASWPSLLSQSIALVQWDRAAKVSASCRAALRARRK
jgi:hypothetical protein